MTSKVATIATPSPDDRQTPWPSIYICGILTLCQAVQFTLYISSLYAYMQLLDTSITETFYA